MRIIVPKKTTSIKKELPLEEYSIHFAPELVDFIKERNKTKTYRYGNKYEFLKVGDTVTIKEYGTNNVVGKALVLGKSKTTFAKLPLDIDGHEVYKDKKQQKKVFSGYYAYLGREIKDDDPFLVFDFELI